MMPRFDSPPGFWSDFAARYWGRAPVVLKRPFDGVLGTAEEALDACREATRRLQAHKRRVPIRGFIGERELVDPTPLLPGPDDTSLVDFGRRLRRAHGEFGLMVTELQAMHPALWGRTASLLDGLHDAVGVPPGGSALDLFIVSQQRGFTGVHKDSQDVFTFVLSGRKRMLVWPFEVLADRPGVTPQGLLRNELLGQICDDELRAKAIVLDAEPGDLIYWPCEYWHISEGCEEPAITLGLGVIRNGNPARFLSTAAFDIVRDRVDAGPMMPSLSEGSDAVTSWVHDQVATLLSEPRFAKKVDEKILRWMTGHGFDRVPDAADSAPCPDDTWLRGAGARAFAWRRHGEVLLVAAHGHTLDLPAHPALIAICEAITAGDALQVGPYAERLADADVTTSAADRAAVVAKIKHLLALLTRYRALEPVPAPAAAVAAPDTDLRTAA